MMPQRAFTELRVVTSARWLAADLAGGAPEGLRVVQDLGLDSPRSVTATAWWMPHRHATRLALTHREHPLRLTSTGPGWLADLDPRWTRREVWAGRLADLAGCRLWDDGPAFAKPAEVKVAALPAATWDSRAQFAHAAASAGLRAESWAVVSEPVRFEAEFRCFVAPDTCGRPTVVACSPYLVHDQTWDAWESLANAPGVDEATAFAASVLACPTATGPSGWVLDVGLSEAGWAVVEANAAWSSNPYHCPPRGVVTSVLAAQDGTSAARWAWRGDPMVEALARPLRWA